MTLISFSSEVVLHLLQHLFYLCMVRIFLMKPRVIRKCQFI